MSKIYDTLGRKYKAKGLDGMQDFGVCKHNFLLNLCVFKVLFLPNRVRGTREALWPRGWGGGVGLEIQCTGVPL